MIVSQRWPALTRSRAHRFALLAGVIVEGPEDWVVRPVAETYVEVERGTPSATISRLGGLIWRVSPQVSADAALRVATESGNAAVEVRMGLTWVLSL